MAPKIQTVIGDVHPRSLGRTLTHEHLCMDFEHFYRRPPKSVAELVNSEISLSNVGFVRQYPYGNRFNLKFNDLKCQDAVLQDLHRYKDCGGGTIVENTTEGLERNVLFYYNLAHSTDVKIVAGTGFYIEDVQAADVMAYSQEDMYKHMLEELTVGYQNIKAGFIGEVASVWPIRDFERKAIRATGELQEKIGCGVSFHPHRNPEAPFEIIRLYLEAGGKADKAVMSHLDRTLLETEKLLEFSELGTYCQFDLFGIEVSYYQLNPSTDMPSDVQRIEMIDKLVQDGKEEKVLMSHDIHTKHRLTAFGGHGYDHIITNVIPKMKMKGFSQRLINQITIENPVRWLTIEE